MSAHGEGGRAPGGVKEAGRERLKGFAARARAFSILEVCRPWRSWSCVLAWLLPPDLPIAATETTLKRETQLTKPERHPIAFIPSPHLCSGLTIAALLSIRTTPSCRVVAAVF
jgi:hypothetical protein